MSRLQRAEEGNEGTEHADIAAPDWIEKIAAAYDRTVRDFHHGIDPLASIPRELRDSARLKALLDDGAFCNSGAPENRDFLAPRKGMRFLDVGCAADLVNYDLGSWPSEYHGVDISPALIGATRSYAEASQIPVGGLYVTDLADLPFDDQFFDIAAVIGVLEYSPWDYVCHGLRELARVLRSQGRFVVDIPNPSNPHLETMLELEARLGRHCFVHPRGVFELELRQYAEITHVDDSHVMSKYFCSII